MKTAIYKFWALSFLPFLMLSCAEEIPSLSPEGRTGSICKPMVFVADGPLLDSISLYDGVEFSRFDKKEGPAGMSYFGKATDNGSYLAVAPYRPGYKLEGGKIRTNISKKQEARKDALDSLNSVFAAVSNGGKLKFDRLSSALTFSIERVDGITSVTLRGNKSERIAGDCLINVADGIKLEATQDSGDEYSATLYAKTGTLSSGIYCFSLLPSCFSEGVSLSFSRETDSRTAVVNIPGALKIKEGQTSELGGVFPEDLEWNDVISLAFMESPSSGSVAWPFKESVGSTALTTVEGGYVFTVSASSINETRKGSGFVFGPSKGNYISLPHFKGKALSSVRMVTGNTVSNAGSPAITRENGKVVAGAWTGTKNPGDQKVWSFRGEENTPLKLELTEDAGSDGCAIQILELQYRAARENEYFVDEVKTGEIVECNSASGKAKVSLSFKMSNPDVINYSAGFEYRDTTNAEWNKVSLQPETDTVETFLEGLAAGAVYELRSWAQGADDKVPVYGNTVIFTHQTAVKMVFGTESTSSDYYTKWNALWGLSKSSGSTAKGPDEKSYDFCDLNLSFTLWSACGYGYRVASSKYYGLCLAYAGSGKSNYNGWMKLPVIPGLRLSKVKCKMQGASNYDVTVASEVNSVTGVPMSSVGAVSITSSTAKEYTITLNSTISGQAYYLCSGTGLVKTDAAIGRMATFEYLTLIYE